MNIIEMIQKDIDAQKFQSALQKLKKNKEKIEKDFYYFLYGDILRMQGYLRSSIDKYSKALKLNFKTDIKIDILNRLSACYRTIGNKVKAIKNSKEALKLSLKNKIHIENSLLENAMSYRLAGDYSKTIEIFNKLNHIYSQQKDEEGLSYICWALGGIYRLKGNFKKSIYYFQKSYNIALKIKDRDLQAYALLGMGGVLRVSGFVNKSFLTYQKAKKMLDKSDIFGQAYSLCGMANALRQQGKLKEAKENYIKSSKLYKITGDKPDLAFTYWGIGEIFKKEGNFTKALKYFYLAQKLFKEGFEKRGEILNLISIAQTLYISGKLKKSKKIFETAYRKAKKEKLNTFLEIFT